MYLSLVFLAATTYTTRQRYIMIGLFTCPPFGPRTGSQLWQFNTNGNNEITSALEKEGRRELNCATLEQTKKTKVNRWIWQLIKVSNVN